VPPSLGPAANPVPVELSDRELLTVPDGIAPNTTHLEIFSNKLTTLDGLERLRGLEDLQAYNNKLKNFDVFPKLPALRVVNVYNNGIRKLPAEIGALRNLEEVNVAGNKLMALTDDHFRQWSRVTILNLYDNNLVRMGSLAPLAALEELRMHMNNLEAMPTLGPSHPKLTILEIHKNRIGTIADDYFCATPALERLSLWGNQLRAVPPSLCACASLVGAQLQENELTALPEGPWPASLETLFLDKNKITTLPVAFANCYALKRLNLTGLALDYNANHLAEYLKGNILRFPDGIFWGADGQKFGA